MQNNNPQDYDVRDRLIDGRKVHIRAIRTTDKEYLLDVWEHLSSTSRYYRFFSPKKELTDQELRYYTNLDFVTHVGLLALLEEEEGENPIGVGRYVRPKDMPEARTAEIAFTVEDGFQGLGVGTLLLKHLVQVAQASGIEYFNAFVLAENAKMLEVFDNCGLPIEKKLTDYSEWEVILSLEGSQVLPST